MIAAASQRHDAVVIGGGLYGCALALVLRSVFRRVVVIEARDDLLTRASYVNQARVHTGFHYPRSFVTARRSLALYQRFCADFAEAVKDDFTMLYAIPRTGSRVTVRRFGQMFADMKAPILPAGPGEAALFDPDLIEGVFRCREYAFDAAILRRLIAARLDAAGVEVVTGTAVTGIKAAGLPIEVATDRGHTYRSDLVFDATYGQLAGSGLLPTQAAFKYELAEIVLADPPQELARVGITVMDGPFFSFMPFPAEGCHSLTHVRYTPHRAWTTGGFPPLDPPPRSHWMHMQRDATRYVPLLEGLRPRKSLFEVKTVLMRNESDDGRPILMERGGCDGRMITVLGGKVDNIYDLFDALRLEVPGLADADTRYLLPPRRKVAVAP